MSLPAMDASAFAEVKALLGDSFKEVLSITLETLPQQLTLLEQAIKQNNAENIFSVAHRIKSSSGTMGALGLAQKAETIELVARAGSADISEQAHQALQTSSAEVITILKQELSGC